MSKFKLPFNFVPMPEAIWKEKLDLSLSEFRLLGYLLMQVRFGQEVESYSDDELLNGIFESPGKRKDRGCGLSLNSIKQARFALSERGWLVANNTSSDPTRPKWTYRLPLSKLDSNPPDFDSNPPSSDTYPPKVDRCNKEEESTSIEESSIDQEQHHSSKEDFQLESGKPVVNEKSKRDSRNNCDPRFAPVVAVIFEEYKRHNKCNPSFRDPEGKQLKSFLASHDWPVEKISECIRNRFKSDMNPAQEPLTWISKLGNYLAGPLDKYGSLKFAYNTPLSLQNGTGRKPHLLDGMPGPEELAAQRLKENARIPRMPDEKFL